MKTLLLIALAACSAYAVPLPDDGSEVDLVPPRRVITGARAGPSYAGAAAGFRPTIDARDLLRQLFGSGFSPLAPRVDDNCDSASFQLSADVYDMVLECQRSRPAEQDLKQCIVEGLPEDANELRDFLDRDEYRIAGISSSLSIVIVDGESTLKRVVKFRLCPPSDDQNTVEEDGEEEGEQPEQRPAVRPVFRPFSGSSFPFGDSSFGSRPTFQVPNAFSRPNPFFNFDAFKPAFDFRPNFPAFPSFDATDFPAAGYDPENCVKQTFQLPKEQFDLARTCQFSQSLKECLSEKLGDYEESKELLDFVGADQMVVMDSRFFSSVSIINGVVTRKNKIQLTHCKEAEVEEEEQEPAGEEEQEQEQETTPREITTTQQEEQSQPDDDFEP